jgi:HK97 family phage major capsid protein
VETQDIEAQLKQIKGEILAAVGKDSAKVEELEKKQRELQKQADAIDLKLNSARFTGEGQEASVGAGVREFKTKVAELKDSLKSHGRVGFEIPSLLERKSVILSTGITSTEPTSGVQGAGRYAWRLRSLFRSIDTQLPTIGTLRSNAETLNVSPQVEGQTKAESTITYNLVNQAVATLATFINVSRQALDDVDGLGEFLNATLVWALEKKAELEILSGDGTGVHVEGLTTVAAAFDSTILSSTLGYNRLDILGAAATQLMEAGYSPDFAVVSPRNWFRMVSLRSTTGEYVLNLPTSAVGERAYQLQILPTPSVSGDDFLVGDSSQAIIRQRMQTQVAVSFEHASNWTSNLATILAEQRFALQVLRPDAYVAGTLASSPA